MAAQGISSSWACFPGAASRRSWEALPRPLRAPRPQVFPRPPQSPNLAHLLCPGGNTEEAGAAQPSESRRRQGPSLGTGPQGPRHRCPACCGKPPTAALAGPGAGTSRPGQREPHLHAGGACWPPRRRHPRRAGCRSWRACWQTPGRGPPRCSGSLCSATEGSPAGLSPRRRQDAGGSGPGTCRDEDVAVSRALPCPPHTWVEVP